MSTEQQKDLETNTLADWLGRTWTRFKQGKLISYPVMALLLILAAGVGLWLYIRSERAATASQAWISLEGATTDKALEEVAARFPDSTAARVAELHRARNLLGPEGIDRLVTGDPAEREKALKNVDAARDLMTRLADQFGDGQPVLRAECYLGLAKAEAALLGIGKDGNSNESRGSVEKLTGWLDKLADAAAGTPWGEGATKLAASLKEQKGRQGWEDVQRSLYNMALFGPPPGLGPLAPDGGPPLGGIPGLPGLGGPAAPPTTPAVTPAPTPATTPPATGNAPIPPALAPVTPSGQPSNPTPPKQ